MDNHYDAAKYEDCDEEHMYEQYEADSHERPDDDSVK